MFGPLICSCSRQFGIGFDMFFALGRTHEKEKEAIREEERGIYFQALIDSENDSRRTPIIEFFVDKAIDLMKQRIALAEHRDTPAPDFHEPSA